jgi:hypothetical protein
MTHLYNLVVIKKREQNVDITSIPRPSSMQCIFRRFIANPLTSGFPKPYIRRWKGWNVYPKLLMWEEGYAMDS